MARGKSERLAVPAMPMAMAILCCIVNVILPGFGTMVAGLSSFCCARNEDMKCFERCGSCCIGFLIGFLQLLLVPIFLIGWIWSIIWGTSFIAMSAEYYKDISMNGAVISGPSTQTRVTVIQNTPPPQQYIPHTGYIQQPLPLSPPTGYPVPEYDPPPPYSVTPSAPYKPY